MYRRAALASAVLVLALPAGAAASSPVADAGGAAVQPASGLKVTSLRASKTGREVTVKVHWDRALILRKAQRERFTVRLLAGPAGARRLLGTVSRRAPRGTSETVRLRLNARNARRVKGSSRVFATVTQQFDSPDTDRLYELNHVSIASMRGKKPFAGAAAGSCPKVIAPGTDMSGCQIPGSNLAGADLSNVNFYDANLELSLLSGADLRTTNLTRTDLTGALLTGARMSAPEQSALTFPRDGETIEELIDSAKTSVDVVIYTFGGPNIVGQQGKPGALMRAVQRGVNVRVIVNSGNKGCTSDEQAAQSTCLGLPVSDPVYATEAALKWASENPDTTKTDKAGKYRVQFSSQNYQITHQKTILIDTSDKNGNPLYGGDLPPTAQVLVSTGNLSSYGWGTYSYWSKATQKYVVSNKDYLTNPAKTCGKSCPDEWAARDFAIRVTDQDLIERITAVYAADQTCKRWDEAPVLRELLDSKLADTWANGTLLADGLGYPVGGTAAFYAGFGPNPLLQADPDMPDHVKPQGNSRKRQLDLIASATETLLVYNEEMDDPDILNALVAAEKRGVDVRVVMSSTFDPKTGKPAPDNELPVILSDGTVKPGTGNYKFSYLVSNGVRVRLSNGKDDDVLYIHGKAIVADGLNAFMGSENFGYASMNYNRELGLMLTTINNHKGPDVKTTAPSIVSVGGVAAIMSAFSKDWNSPDAVQYAAQTPIDQPYPGYPTAEYPQPPDGTAFTDEKTGQFEYNALCVPPGAGGDRFEPALPTRTLPVQP